jgi:hypothetical protein
LLGKSCAADLAFRQEGFFRKHDLTLISQRALVHFRSGPISR